jgi:L-ascorbate metabolism protein UlaG (beta-lactamase superfamily)
MLTRRTFVATATAIGASTVMPYAALAQSGGSNTFETDAGPVTIHPISHASFVMETPGRMIYNDPVGEASAYADYPTPDLILITHEHGDHYNPGTLRAIVGENTQLLTNPAVYDMLPEDLQAKATAIANGEGTSMGDMGIEAIPAYNITDGRLQYHPEGRDNGYILTVGGRRIYIAGDTEGIPEMRELEDIYISFVPMNLPYTMELEQAASAVNAFQPTYVYPYHYRDADVEQFASLVDGETEVRMGAWYARTASRWAGGLASAQASQ